MRILGTVVEISMLTMLDSWQNLALGGSITLQLIGDDYTWDITQSLEQLTEEFLRGLLIAAALHQNVQDVAVLIDRPSEIAPLALDGQKHFIKVPFIAGA